MEKAYLVLEDGTVFEGYGFGAVKDTVGELTYTTGVCGYLETLTDPNYYGQIIVQTFPLMGNYGIIESDLLGDCKATGYVVREWCDTPSNFRCEYDMDTYLKNQGVPGICGIDTRTVAAHLREHGSMNATITHTLPTDTTAIKAYTVQNAVAAVTVEEATEILPNGEATHHVAVLDFGVKPYIIDALTARGCRVSVLPSTTTAEEIVALKVDGLLLSGGPGNPIDNKEVVQTVAALFGKFPLMGIGLGHQILALANGGRVQKMHQGHRGSNQPVRQVGTLCTYITAQNHGYVVLSDTVQNGNLMFYNVNDNTCEGIEYPAHKAFSIQFEPETHTGHRNPAVLFDRFVTMMGGK